MFSLMVLARNGSDAGPQFRVHGYRDVPPADSGQSEGLAVTALDMAHAIRDRSNATLRGVPSGDGPSLADLAALHGLIERVREWPLGTPAAARGALIGLVALGSWGGAALFELLIERALGG